MKRHLLTAAILVVGEANARRMGTAKRKALSGVPANWPFPESHHAW